jgi:hypothetical protein
MRRGGQQNAGRWAAPRMTAAQHETQLISLLYSCRPHMLDRYTAEELHRTHSKMDLRKVEYLLIVARQKRAGEARE